MNQLLAGHVRDVRRNLGLASSCGCLGGLEGSVGEVGRGSLYN